VDAVEEYGRPKEEEEEGRGETRYRVATWTVPSRKSHVHRLYCICVAHVCPQWHEHTLEQSLLAVEAIKLTQREV